MIRLLVPTKLCDLVSHGELILSDRLSVIGAEEPIPPSEIKGKGEILISSLASYNENFTPGTLAFAVKEEFFRQTVEGGAAAVIIPQKLADTLTLIDSNVTLVIASDPRLLFVAILEYIEKSLRPSNSTGDAFFKDRSSCQIDPTVIFGPYSYVGASVTLGKNVTIGPRVIIEDEVTIGDDSVIDPGAVLRWRVSLGKRVIIHVGAVIGEDGFGYTQLPQKNGRLIHYKNSHLGTVVVEDDVEIGALTCIDRGLVGDTVIGKGSKIDNLVQIGHNCQVGSDAIIVSQAGIAGHSLVGDRAFLLGQAGISHGSIIGEDAIITGQCGVTGTIPPGKRPWGGSPAVPLDEQLKTLALMRRYLPQLKELMFALHKSESFEDLKKEFPKK
jgi:UDP-3-O-[3-hydroxymyristoyl] glucosamine N-acyltransferase